MLGEISLSCARPGKRACGTVESSTMKGMAVVRAHAVQAEHRLAVAQLQHAGLGLVGRRPDDLAALDLAGDADAVGVADVAEADRALVGRLVDDEGAAALAARDQPLALHLVERLAHRADADAELARKLDLVGDRRSGLPGSRRRCAG